MVPFVAEFVAVSWTFSNFIFYKVGFVATKNGFMTIRRRIVDISKSDFSQS
jgi:hypothetical protein